MNSATTKVPVIRNHTYHPHGLKSYVYTLNKFGITPTQPSRYSRDHACKTLVKKQDDGTHTPITAEDQMNDSFYTCPVAIGSPPQIVDLDFDSGSSDFWVWSTNLNRKIQEHGKANQVQIFDPKKSSTFQNMHGAEWHITYGDGSQASGVVGTDVVRIGDITINPQHVELATQISSQFQNQTSSGLLGLAWGKLNNVTPHRVPTPVENMITQKAIPTNAELWSVHLGSVKDQKTPDAAESFYTFGDYDTSVIKACGEEISWTPVDNSQGFWMFSSTTATVNGQTVQLGANQAIADTGTTIMLVSDQLCNAIYSQVNGAQYDESQGGWLIPTVNVDQRPDVSIAVGDKQIIIRKEYLGWADLNDGSNMCFGAIQSRGDNPFDILGDSFLFNCYAIFDVGNTRFGCVQRPDPTRLSN